MAATLELQIRAINQASAELNRIAADLNKTNAAAGNAANGFKTASASSNGLNTSLGGLGRTAVAVALGMGGLNIAVTLAQATLKNTISAASAMNETMSKVGVVFGSSAKDIKDWSKDSATAFGLARGEALETAATFGNLFVSLGLGRPKAAEFSKSIVELAADLASFNNIDPSDVLLKLRAGIVGEVDPLRTLGVAINENIVSQKAQVLGFKQVNGQFTEAEKVQARYALILEQTGTAQGDFKRTSDGLANQQRILKAEFQDAGVALGQQLLPAVREGTTVLASFLGVLNRTGATSDIFGSLTLGAIAFGSALAAVKIAQFTTGLVNGIQAARQQMAVLRQIQAENAALGNVGTSLAGGGKGVALTPNAAIVGATVALVGLDFAARRFTGGGLVDFLTGATDAHNRAAAAARRQGDAERDLLALRNAGVGEADAKRLEINKQITLGLEAQARLQIAIDAAANRPVSDPLHVQADKARGLFADDTKAQVAQIQGLIGPLKLDFADLNAIIKAVPALGPGLADDLKAAEEAGKGAVTVIKDLATVLKEAKDAQSAFNSAVNDLKSFSDVLDPATESLKLQKLELEQLKTKMGDAFGPENQGRLDTITRQIDLLQGRTAIYNQQLTLVAAIAGKSFGETVNGVTLAADSVNRLNVELLKLPLEQRIKIAMLLPDLEMSRLLRFLTYIQQGFAVDVALRIAQQTPAQATVPNTSFLGGPANQLPGAAQQNQNAVEQALRDLNFKRIQDEANGLTNSLGPLGAEAGKAAKELSEANKDLIALAEAFAAFHAVTGGTIQDFRVLLQLGQDQIDLNQRMEQAAINLRVHEIEAADGAYQLQLGLVAIAELFAEVGESAGNLQLATGALNDFQSALDQLLNRPTKESAVQQLQLDQLERQAHILEREGARSNVPKDKQGNDIRTSRDRELDAINKHIDAIKKEIAIRQDDLKIIKDKAVIADKTLPTDNDLANQAFLLTTAIGDTSANVDKFAGAVFFETLATINLANAHNEAAASIRAVTAGVGDLRTQLILAYNAFHPNAPLPLSEGGLGNFGAGTPAILHGIEAVIPLSNNRAMRALASGFSGGNSQGGGDINIEVHITADSEASDNAMRRLAAIVTDQIDAKLRLQGLSGSAVNTNFNTPGGR